MHLTHTSLSCIIKNINQLMGVKKMSDDAANTQMDQRLKQMQEQRDADIRSINGNRPPTSF